MKFKIETISNMVCITDESDQIWKTWDKENVSERKIQNAMKKIQSNYKEKVEFIRA